MKNEPTITTTRQLPVRQTTQQQEMRSPLVPVARLGASDCPLGTARRVFSEYVTAVPHQAAEWLKLDAPAIVQRWITVMINGEIALTSTSYIPVDTTSDTADDPQAWQNSDIGALALAGYSIMSLSLSHLTAPPTPGERVVFHLAEECSIGVLACRFSVNVGGQTLPAGVIVLAPSERLVLRAEPEQRDGLPPKVLLNLADTAE